MKTWTVSACLALALATAAAANPAGAFDLGWRGGVSVGPAGLLLVDQPVSGCVGFINKEGKKDHDCGFGPENADKPGGITAGDIARQMREHGYEVYDIDREGDRFEATGRDEDGDRVIVYFDAATGHFIRQRYY